MSEIRRVMVRYKVKPEHVRENEALVATVFAELARAQPGGLAYATCKLADGVTFVHIAEVDVANGHPLQALPAFQAFTRDIATRCDEPPVTTPFDFVGNFRAFGVA